MKTNQFSYLWLIDFNYFFYTKSNSDIKLLAIWHLWDYATVIVLFQSDLRAEVFISFVITIFYLVTLCFQ